VTSLAWIERPARALSLCAGLSIFVLMSVAPFLLGHAMTPRLHAAAGLLGLGAAGACFHGFGLAPRAMPWRLAFSPLVVWPVLAWGLCLALT